MGMERALQGLPACNLPPCQVNLALQSPNWRGRVESCTLACPHQQIERPKKDSATLRGLEKKVEGTRCPASTCGSSPGKV